MSRFLFVVPPVPDPADSLGHIAAELRRRGGTVAWALHEQASGATPLTDRRFPLDAALSSSEGESLRARVAQVGSLARARIWWEEVVVRVGVAATRLVVDAIAEFAPDVVVVEQTALAGALAARLTGVPWVTIASSGALLREAGAFAGGTEAWTTGLLTDAQHAVGLDPVEDPEVSPSLVVLNTTAVLAGAADRPTAHLLVGPTVPPLGGHGDPSRPGSTPPARPIVVALGEVRPERARRFHAAAIEATADTAPPLVVVAPSQLVPPSPRVTVGLGLADAIRDCAAAVLDREHPLVGAALAYGTPLVLTRASPGPGVLAGQALALGGAVEVPFARVSAASVRDALARVVAPETREVAAAVRDSVAAAGGPAAAAAAIEALVGDTAHPRVPRTADAGPPQGSRTPMPPAAQRYLDASDEARLHLGCGHHLLPGWLNTDLIAFTEDVVPLDASQPLPFPDDTFRYVFAEHLLVLLTYEEMLECLRECRRTLRDDGVLRIAFPSIERLARLYDTPRDELGEHYLRWAAGSSGVPDLLSPAAAFNALVMNWGLRSLLDEATMRNLLERAGFDAIEERPIGESPHRALRAIEAHGAAIGEYANLYETVVLEASPRR